MPERLPMFPPTFFEVLVSAPDIHFVVLRIKDFVDFAVLVYVEALVDFQLGFYFSKLFL